MKIVVACDSFKHALSSPDVCRALADGFREGCPGSTIVELPLADGGEGTANAIIAATGATVKELMVTGPLGTPFRVQAGILPGGKIGVMDMASASGIQLSEPKGCDPFRATTKGTGELFLSLVREGVEKIIIGIGGSATVDGGAGFLKAIGVRLLDREGKEIDDGPEGFLSIDRIDPGDAEAIMRSIHVSIASDVTNPLLGPTGAATVFGPQKGVRPEEMPHLERCLARWADIVIHSGYVSDCMHQGDGAAGGLGFALRAFLTKAKTESGARLVMKAVGFHEAVRGAHCVATGEGRTDAQTADGKLCSVVAAECAALGVPVILVSGAVDDPEGILFATYDAVFSIARGPGTLADAIRDTRQSCRLTARSIGRLLSER